MAARGIDDRPMGADDKPRGREDTPRVWTAAVGTVTGLNKIVDRANLHPPCPSRA